MDSSIVSYETLAAGEGRELFGDSWTLYHQWLQGLHSMDAPLSHKVWTLTSVLSMISNHTAHTAFVPRLGHARLNLGIMFVGHIQTVVENLITIAEQTAYGLGIPLAPTDTDGHRQGFISALHGRELQGSRRRKPRMASSKPLAQVHKEESTDAAKTAIHARLAALLGNIVEDSHSDTDDIDPIERTLFEPRPTAMVVHYLRDFLKESYTELTGLLTQCILNRRIDIHLQQNRYLVQEPALSILVGANLDDLIGRNGQINRQFLANMIPVYNPSFYGTAARMPAMQDLKLIRESLHSLATGAMQNYQQELRLSHDGDSALHEVGEARILTTDVNLVGLSDRRVYHVFRLAGIIAFARRSHEIGERDVMMAHTMLALNETSVEACYTALHAERSEAKLYLKLIEYVELHGRVDVATLIAYLKSATNTREQDLTESLSRLFNIGRITQNADGFITLNNEGAELRLEALTRQLRIPPIREVG